MYKSVITTVLGVILAAMGFAYLAVKTTESTQIFIVTGGVTGVYYPAGGAICRLVNKDRRDHGIRCSAESTDGSIFNVNSLRSGDLELGIVQSDWQHHAYLGDSALEDSSPFDDLRSIFSLHPEPVTVIASQQSGIIDINDLKQKRVNIGNPGSGGPVQPGRFWKRPWVDREASYLWLPS